MSPVTVIWSALAAACILLGSQHFLVWYRMRASPASLSIAAMAVGTAVMAAFELLMMRAGSPGTYATALRWLHVGAFLAIVAIVGLVRTRLRAGRAWLGWTVCILRGVALVPNFLAGANLNYLAIDRLRRVPFLGESVSVADGTLSPWTFLGVSSLVLLVAFTADASVTVWRRGERRAAAWVGGSVLVLGLFALVQVPLVLLRVVDMPIMPSVAFLGVLAVMTADLSRGVLRSAKLSEELRESEARFRGIFEGAQEGMCRVTPSGRILMANTAMARMMGYASVAEFVSEVDDIGERVWAVPGDCARLLDLIERQGAVSGHECRFRRRDGTPLWVRISGQAVRGPDGRTAFLDGFVQDVTARKEAELELERQRNELGHTARVSMLGQLASSMAHELRQPLGAIMRNAEAAELLLEDPAPDLQELRAVLADIRQDDGRAEAVIDRLRSLIRRRDVERRSLDLAALAREVVDLVRADADHRHVRIALEDGPRLPSVRGDRVQLQQVVLNLVLNALEAVSAREAPDRRVVLRAWSAGDSVGLVVIDSGGGIPASAMAKLFEPFWTTRPDGLGMGLAISLAIIEAHGGRLWAENEEGGGARFTFSLPSADGGGPA